jgi:hypothetical protein
MWYSRWSRVCCSRPPPGGGLSSRQSAGVSWSGQPCAVRRGCGAPYASESCASIVLSVLPFPSATLESVCVCARVRLPVCARVSVCAAHHCLAYRILDDGLHTIYIYAVMISCVVIWPQPVLRVDSMVQVPVLERECVYTVQYSSSSRTLDDWCSNLALFLYRFCPLIYMNTSTKYSVSPMQVYLKYLSLLPQVGLVHFGSLQ